MPASQQQPIGVLPAGRGLSVVVLGEGGSGKTSLIDTFVARLPSPPRRASTQEPIELSRNMLESYGTAFVDYAPHLAQLASLTLTDTAPPATAAEVADAVRGARPDVAVVCCSCADPAGFVRLAEFWLPALGERAVDKPAHWPYLPVVVAWTKYELLDGAPREAWEQAARRVHELCAPHGAPPHDLHEVTVSELVGRIMDWLADRFAHFQTHSYLSVARPEEEGNAVSEIAIVWEAALQACAFPRWPLVTHGSEEEGSMTPEAEMALERVFRICDRDVDNVLTVDEYGHLLRKGDPIHLPEHHIHRLFQDLKAVDAAYYDEEHLGITWEGFRYLMQRRLEMQSPKEVWWHLIPFGYTCGAGGLQLEPLQLPPVNPRARYVLSSPAGLFDACAFPATPERVRAFPGSSSTGIGFVAGLFTRFASGAVAGGGEAALTEQDVADMFAVVAAAPGSSSSSSHPFGPLHPHCVNHGAGGLLRWEAWLQLWLMLAATQPAAAYAALHALGFATLSSAAGAQQLLAWQLDLSPLPALTAAPPRDAAARRHAAAVHGYDDAAADVGRIAVFGSAGSGKTTACLAAVNATFSRRGLAPPPVGEPAHFVVPMPPPAAKAAAAAAAAAAASHEGGSGGSRASPPPAVAAPLAAGREPRTLVFTEVPAQATTRALATEDSGPFAAARGPAFDFDAALFVVDPASQASVNFFRGHVQLVPPGLPTLVLLAPRLQAVAAAAAAAAAGGEGGRPAARSEGELVLRALVSGGPGLVDVLRAGAEGNPKYAVLDEVSELPAMAEPLDVDVMSVYKRDWVRYLGLCVHKPRSANPRNAQVRAEETRARRVRAAWAVGAAAGVLLGGALLYRSSGWVRGRVDGAAGGLAAAWRWVSPKRR